MAEGKKTKAHQETARPQNLSVGEMLLAARTAKNLSLEEVSASIHVRGVQLRALEENNIDALPGMTYAVGFVRSYANFLGMNGAEIVLKFKAEHGHAPAAAQLSFPEPVQESRMPDPIMVGVGAFLAIVVLIFWTIYSNMNDGSDKIAGQIPEPPAITTTSEPMPPEMPLVEAAVTPPPVVSASPEAVVIQPVPAVLPPAEEKPVVEMEAPVIAVAKTKIKEPLAEKTSEEGGNEDSRPSENEEDGGVINIKRGKTRITLRASQASWVQITDHQQNVIYRKVLRPDEEYSVPDQPGLSLVTANAGGLDIYVDGKKTQAIGKPGEIVRGIVLDPAELKQKKVRVRD